MNLDRYLRDYGRTAVNVPSILRQWGELTPVLQQHYADELLLMLARRPEMRELARMQGRILSVAPKMAFIDSEILAYRSDIVVAMGFDPQDMLLPSATTSVGARDTGPGSPPVPALAA